MGWWAPSRTGMWVQEPTHHSDGHPHGEGYWGRRADARVTGMWREVEGEAKVVGDPCQEEHVGTDGQTRG